MEKKWRGFVGDTWRQGGARKSPNIVHVFSVTGSQTSSQVVASQFLYQLPAAPTASRHLLQYSAYARPVGDTLTDYIVFLVCLDICITRTCKKK